MANLKLQIGLLEAKIGKKSNMKSIDKRVKARVKGAKKEYLSLQLQVLIKEKLARKLFHVMKEYAREIKKVKNAFIKNLSKKADDSSASEHRPLEKLKLLKDWNNESLILQVLFMKLCFPSDDSTTQKAICDLFKGGKQEAQLYLYEKLQLPLPTKKDNGLFLDAAELISGSASPLDKQIYDAAKLQTFHKQKMKEFGEFLAALLLPLQEQAIGEGEPGSGSDPEEVGLVANPTQDDASSDVETLSLSEDESVFFSGDEMKDVDDADFVVDPSLEVALDDDFRKENFVESLGQSLPPSKRTRTLDEIVKNHKKTANGSSVKQMAMKPKKNRPGQSARRKKYEEQYGDSANHILKATLAEARKPREPKANDHYFRKPSNYRGFKGGMPSKMTSAKDVMTESLHPSWEAKKQQALKLQKAQFQGKRQVFDD